MKSLSDEAQSLATDSWSLTTGTAIASNTNLNDLTTTGNYICSSNSTAGTLVNSPTSNAFSLKVIYSLGSGSPTYFTQIIIDYLGDIFIRSKVGSNDWQNWKQISATAI